MISAANALGNSNRSDTAQEEHTDSNPDFYNSAMDHASAPDYNPE